MIFHPHFFFSLQPTKGMGSALLIKSNFPELAPQDIEDHELSQKDNYFNLSETVLRVCFHTLLRYVFEIIPHQMIFISNVVQVELVVNYLTKAVLIEVTMVVELRFAQLIPDRGRYP